MKLKPFLDIDPHEERNLFALDIGEGKRGSLVTIKDNGFVNNASFGVAYNINSSVPNVYSPRMEVKAKVKLSQPTDTGKPYGVMMYDTTDKGFDKPLIYDSQRRAEKQAVVSGEAVTIVRKGMLLVSGFQSGFVGGPGSGCVAGVSGEWSGVAIANATGTLKDKIFGECLGTADADGYILVDINCYV